MIDFNERAIALSAVAKVIHIVVTGPLAVEELDPQPLMHRPSSASCRLGTL
jgi:hypothetical protein